MEWQIVTVLIALVGFGVTVIKPILQLNGSIVKLTDQIENLQLIQNDSKDDLKSQAKRLDDHEHRITVLENHK